MKLSLVLKMLSMEIFLALELTTNQDMMKESCFEFLQNLDLDFKGNTLEIA